MNVRSLNSSDRVEELMTRSCRDARWDVLLIERIDGDLRKLRLGRRAKDTDKKNKKYICIYWTWKDSRTIIWSWNIVEREVAKEKSTAQITPTNAPLERQSQSTGSLYCC